MLNTKHFERVYPRAATVQVLTLTVFVALLVCRFQQRSFPSKVFSIMPVDLWEAGGLDTISISYSVSKSWRQLCIEVRSSTRVWDTPRRTKLDNGSYPLGYRARLCLGIVREVFDHMDVISAPISRGWERPQEICANDFSGVLRHVPLDFICCLSHPNLDFMVVYCPAAVWTLNLELLRICVSQSPIRILSLFALIH